MERYQTFIFSPVRWGIFLAIVLIVSTAGLLRLKVESNPIAFFPVKSDMVQSDNVIASFFGGTRFFSMTLTRKDTNLTAEEPWHELDEIPELLRADPAVGNVASVVPLARRVSRLLTGKPFSPAGISLLLGGKSLFSKKFDDYLSSKVSADRRTVKIDLTCENNPSLSYAALANRLARTVEKRFPRWEVRTAGTAILNDAMISVIINTQITSLLTTLATVFLVLCLIFRSLRIGLIAIFPIALAALFINACMGLFGVSLNLITVVIVNACIGVGIDYAIHYISGYQLAAPRAASRREALLRATVRKGPAILFNTYVVGIGFLVLALSTFPPIRHFGFFVFISMIATSTFALVFLPVLLSLGTTPHNTQ